MIDETKDRYNVVVNGGGPFVAARPLAAGDLLNQASFAALR
jgi:hypothetical protein